tara:strand:- start:306 stop:1184 length:879 start_codon:yes stop_codon:yes gene_type:complete
MAFLDNSGDIIIDAVLTDTGRYRLAKGDGTFSIKKFALGDDEIDYELYNLTASSGRQDLQILQTPILEAFTNNAASLKSKLITIPRNNILYLPVLQANNLDAPAINTNLNMYVVAVDKNTQELVDNTMPVMMGETTTKGPHIRVDQGIDSPAISPEFSIDLDLLETQYMIEIDNRLGMIVSTGGAQATVGYIDDDMIATYVVTKGSDSAFVTENIDRGTADEVISGPRGTTLVFKIQSSIELNSSSYLFTTLGSTGTVAGVAGTVSYIDTTVRIYGVMTGVSIDLPVRLIKT